MWNYVNGAFSCGPLLDIGEIGRYIENWNMKYIEKTNNQLQIYFLYT